MRKFICVDYEKTFGSLKTPEGKFKTVLGPMSEVSGPFNRRFYFTLGADSSQLTANMAATTSEKRTVQNVRFFASESTF